MTRTPYEKPRSELTQRLRCATFVLLISVLGVGCASIPAPIQPAVCDQKIAGEMMTLASIAYISEEQPRDIKRCAKHALARTQFATADNFELIWGPVERNGNMAFLVRRKDSQDYVVAIRGTDFASVGNLLEDGLANQIGVSEHVWPQVRGEQISAGIAMGLKNIQGMFEVSPHGSKLSMISLLDVLKQAATTHHIKVTVTGHSLGGGLTTVVMRWLQAQIKSSPCETCSGVEIDSYSFAGQTAGNKVFARHFDDLFAHRFCRVPILIPPLAELLIGLDAYLKILGWDYQQVAGEWITSAHESLASDYASQLEQQHNHNCYLALVGAREMASTGPAC